MQSRERYLAIFFIFLIAFALYISLTNSLTKNILKDEKIFGLVIGCDEVDYAKHADTIIFLCYQPKNHFLNLLFIPRDTRIEIENLKFHRINELYTYIFRQERNPWKTCQVLKETIETLLSSEERQIKIPYYCEANYRGFVKLIDLIGGIPIKIDKIMDYHDQVGNLHIHFEPGEYFLSGQKALEYVRYRDETGDTERIIRQQRFLRSLFNRMKNPLVIFKLPLIIKEMSVHFYTNFSFWDILAASIEAKNLSLKNVRIAGLPGNPVSTYWQPNREKIKTVIESLFAPEFQEINLEKKEKVKGLTVPSITAEVWNATDEPRLAFKIAKFLRRQGIDVVRWGNYERRKESTLLIDRTGNLEKAQRVAKILSVKDIITYIEPATTIDLSVIVGEDFLKNKKFSFTPEKLER